MSRELVVSARQLWMPQTAPSPPSVSLYRYTDWGGQNVTPARYVTLLLKSRCGLVIKVCTPEFRRERNAARRPVCQTTSQV